MKKLVYVTGGGRGIGQAIAVKLANEGYVVAACSRNIDELRETQKKSKGEIRVASVDVTQETGLHDWMNREQAESRAEPWGLVTAAGIYGPIGKFTENNWEEWRQAIEINLFGTALSVRLFAQKMMTIGTPGRIVLLSGGGATQPQPRFTSYAASKSAVVRLGETLAIELKDYNITVNSVAPGAVNTKIFEELLQAGPAKVGKEAYEKALKQKESGGVPPEKAADLTHYLLSEKSGHITGRLLSAVWDPWPELQETWPQIENTDIYTLRRIVPEDRVKK